MRFFYKKLDEDGAIVKNLLSKWTPVFEPLKKTEQNAPELQSSSLFPENTLTAILCNTQRGMNAS